MILLRVLTAPFYFVLSSGLALFELFRYGPKIAAEGIVFNSRDWAEWLRKGKA